MGSQPERGPVTGVGRGQELVFPAGRGRGAVPKVDTGEGFLPLPFHRALGCRAYVLGEPLVPGPHSVEMDLRAQWNMYVCGRGVGYLPRPLGCMEEVFLGHLLPPSFPSPPHPTTAHTHTPLQEQGLFVGLIHPAPLEVSSINKPSFMGW